MTSVIGLRFGVGLLLIVGLAVGCKQGGSAAGTTGAKAFQSAAPELRAAWDVAVAADQTNGYVVAYTALMELRHPSALTPEQLQVVNASLDGLITRLSKSVQRGDAAAQAAAQEISKLDKKGLRLPEPAH